MAAQLKAGAATSVITPFLGASLAGHFNERRATDIHDALHAKALVLESGRTRLALVVCDVIATPREPLDKAKALIHERCGIPPEQVMISGTHTHTGPSPCGLLGAPEEEGYWEMTVPKIADSVQLAVGRLRNAEIGFGSGSEPRCVFNRRWRMKDGTVRMNPPRFSSDLVEPVGPTDPEVGVLCLREPDTRKIIAVMANYALHYVGGGNSLAVSADYFAVFGRILQRMMGQEFVGIMANGCCGDVNNINFRTPPPERAPYEQQEKVAAIIAAETVKTIEFMSFTRECDLAAANEFFTIGLRRPTPDQLEADRERLAADDFETPTEKCYAEERLRMEEAPEEMTAQVQAMRMGDLGLVALSGEVFCQLGLDVKARSPAQTTFVVELANDYVGYVPTKIGFEHGGYETWLARSAKVAAGSGEALTASGVRLLKQLFPAG